MADLEISNISKLNCDISKSLFKFKCSKDGIKWFPHPSRWVKINMNGVMKRNLRPVGCGGVVHDNNDRLVSMMALTLGT